MEIQEFITELSNKLSKDWINKKILIDYLEQQIEKETKSKERYNRSYVRQDNIMLHNLIIKKEERINIYKEIIDTLK